jgi:hypothetical protein
MFNILIGPLIRFYIFMYFATYELFETWQVTLSNQLSNQRLHRWMDEPESCLNNALNNKEREDI